MEPRIFSELSGVRFFFINIFTPKSILYSHIYVVVQFYPWFEFYFLLFLGVLMYENEFERKEKKI